MRPPAPPLVIAHRGDPLRLRENTLPSLASAVAAGADWVEVDVRLTRDGVPVLLHDDTLARLWGHERRIAELTRAEADALTASDEHRIPTLRQALQQLATPLMLDVIRPAEAVAALAEAERAGALERVVFCGHPTALARVRAHAPTAVIAMSWESPLPPRAPLLRAVRPDYLNYFHRWVTPGRISRGQRLGLRVSAWTVDHPPRMAALAAAGLDALITNDPAAARAAFRQVPGNPTVTAQ